MATLKTAYLPDGWTGITGLPEFDVTRIGKRGRWQVVENDDYAVLTLSVSYRRSDYEVLEDLRIDDLYSFFLAMRGSHAFLVDDELDNTHDSRNGSGIVKSINGQLRLFKRYTSGIEVYEHPITRPKAGIVLGGGAAGGSVNYSTGVVTGSGAGTWTGGFYRPMLFPENGLSYARDIEGIVEVTAKLEEQLEI